MKSLTVFAILFLLVQAPTAGAAPGILPFSFNGWMISSAETQVSAKNLEQIAPDKAAVLREYGITLVERGSYSQGAQNATITLYRMADPTAAFGAFTYLRDPKMTALSLGQQSVAFGASAGNRALFVVGNLVLDVSSDSALPGDQDLKALADALRPKSDHAPFPIISGFLPSAGMVQNSDWYVLGRQGFAQAFPVGAVNQRDWIGFDKSAEAMVADYHLPGQSKDKDALLLVVLYPTQQVAADQFSGFDKWLILNADATPGDARPAVYGKRTGPLVVLLSGAESSHAAIAMLDQVRYSSQVTWDEPTHELTDPNIGTIVVGAIMGTGSIMLFCVVAGIGFGGLRLFMKVLLPGKVFDRNDQVEILQLGLTSKPIQAKDFYSVDTSSGS